MRRTSQGSALPTPWLLDISPGSYPWCLPVLPWATQWTPKAPLLWPYADISQFSHQQCLTMTAQHPAQTSSPLQSLLCYPPTLPSFSKALFPQLCYSCCCGEPNQSDSGFCLPLDHEVIQCRDLSYQVIAIIAWARAQCLLTTFWQTWSYTKWNVVEVCLCFSSAEAHPTQLERPLPCNTACKNRGYRRAACFSCFYLTF